MTIEAANALYRYFEALYELNQNVIALCGADVLDSRGQYEKQIETVIHLVPKLIPYKYHKRECVYKLVNSDGLLEFEKEIPFLKTDYDQILKDHMEFLINIKALRNKLEHKIQGVNVIASGSGSDCLFEITYVVSDKEIQIKAQELIAFVEDMNVLFSKIQLIFNRFAYQQNINDHPYYRRMLRFSFKDFNKIYVNDLLRIFGKTLFSF